MLDRLRTAGLIALVTLLIWLWAEAESLSTQFFSPRVEFVSRDESVVVRVLDSPPAWTGTVRLRLQGATTSLDRAQRVLATALKLNPGVGVVPSTPGEHAIDLREALRQSPEVRRLGLTIVAADPPTVRIGVDTLTTIELPVRAVLPGVDLDGEPTIDPPVASVRLPMALAERALASGAGFLAAAPDSDALGRLRDDAPQTVRARLMLADWTGGAYTVSPASAQLVVRVRSSKETWTIKSVPVWITLPHTETSRWDVQVLDEFILDVAVTGPRDVIRALRERDQSVVASVALSSDDLERGIASKGVVFGGAPPGVLCTAAQTTVRVKITRRQPPR